MRTKRGRKFKRVAVLKGGFSAERAVSLDSGAAVAAALRAAGYTVAEIDVIGDAFQVPRGTEAVFIALHGTFGEDGGAQQCLEAQGIPYTGSGVAASRTAFDKRLSKEVFVRRGILTPPYELVAAGQALRQALPVVVKPPRQGSTIGINRVMRPDEWPAALTDALRFGNEVLVEAFIPGRELTVGLVGQQVLPAIEIAAPDGWYDYTAKYNSGGRTRYLLPAPITRDCAARCAAIAQEAFEALGCRGFGRVDFRMNAAGELWVLELNTIPGFTANSLLPKAARLAGMNFAVLCDRIMRQAALD